MARSPNTTYTAPVGSIDLAAEGDIWPCHECLPWHLEVIRDADTGDVFVREWHAVECPAFVQLLTVDDREV